MFNLFWFYRKDAISFDIVAKNGNMSKQHLTLPKGLNFMINSFDIVAVFVNKVECCFDKVERCSGAAASRGVLGSGPPSRRQDDLWDSRKSDVFEALCIQSAPLSPTHGKRSGVVGMPCLSCRSCTGWLHGLFNCSVHQTHARRVFVSHSRASWCRTHTHARVSDGRMERSCYWSRRHWAPYITRPSSAKKHWIQRNRRFGQRADQALTLSRSLVHRQTLAGVQRCSRCLLLFLLPSFSATSEWWGDKRCYLFFKRISHSYNA